jgi:hypothetical protein
MTDQIFTTTNNPETVKVCGLHSGVAQQLSYADHNNRQLSTILQRISKLETKITLMFGLGMPVISGAVSMLVYFLTKA